MATPKKAPVSEGRTMFCSFCEKEHYKARKLIAGPDNVFICDECISLCNEILEEESLVSAKTPMERMDTMAALAQEVSRRMDLLAKWSQKMAAAAEEARKPFRGHGDTMH